MELLIFLAIYSSCVAITFWGFYDHPKYKDIAYISFVPIVNYPFAFFGLMYVLEKVFTKGDCKGFHHFSKVKEDEYKCDKCSKVLEII